MESIAPIETVLACGKQLLGVRHLTHLFVVRGVPAYIRSDNGSEFTAREVRQWLARVGVKTLYIEPGSPWENGYVESFNGKMRDELLEREIFDTLLEAKVLIERWRVQYNTVRPHSSLGYRPPAPESVWVGRKDGGVPPTVEGFSPPEDTVARKPLSSDGKKLVSLT
jgi:hypothetical protein